MPTLTCIRCPRGCQVVVELDDAGAIASVEGGACPRGEGYARAEVIDPRRVVTTTVCVAGRDDVVVSVKTDGDVPKGRVVDVVRALGACRVDLPVRMGDVVLADVCGTGVDVVATCEVD